MARMRLGDMLIAAGLIDEMQLSAALAHQRQWGGRLGDVLLDKGFLDESVLYMGLARQMHVPLVSIVQLDPAREAVTAVPIELCKKHDLIGIALQDRELTVAMVDPSNVADPVVWKIDDQGQPDVWLADPAFGVAEAAELPDDPDDCIGHGGGVPAKPHPYLGGGDVCTAPGRADRQRWCSGRDLVRR